jgi:hypothetical protein
MKSLRHFCWSVDWSIDRLIDWSIDRLIGRSVGWLVGLEANRENFISGPASLSRSYWRRHERNLGHHYKICTLETSLQSLQCLQSLPIRLSLPIFTSNRLVIDYHSKGGCISLSIFNILPVWKNRGHCQNIYYLVFTRGVLYYIGCPINL